MNRSSWNVGNLGTMSVCDWFWRTPLHAICNVIQTGLPPAAVTILRVTSPTTLMSLFAVPACRPGGYATG